MRRIPAVPTSDHAARSQRGSSLVEVLVAMSIMGLLLMGIVTGYELMVKASGSSKERSTADAALSTMVERARTLTYVPCAPIADVRAAFDTLPRPIGSTARLDGIEYLRPRADVDAASDPFGPSCSADQGAQRWSITVATGGGDVVVVGSVVRRSTVGAP